MSVLRLFFYESLERPRLFVPSLFPLVILAAHGWVQHGTQFPRWRIATRIPPVVIIIILLLQTLMLAPMLRTIRSAPEQAIAWASDAYSPEETLVIAQGSFRAVQMLMADYPMLYTQQFDATDWNQVIHDRAPRYLVVLDRDDVSSTVMQTFNTDYTPLADRTFERDRRIFPQHVTVRVQVFTPLNQLDADALLLDDGGQIHAGQVEHGRYFGEGWFRAEDIGGTMARWAGETATVRITLEETAYQLTFYATPFTANQAVEVWVNDEYVATRLLDGIWAEHQVIIPAEVIQAGVINTITLNHAHAESSPDDSRELSAAYSTFQFQAID
jgi:hypothetical protein